MLRAMYFFRWLCVLAALTMLGVATHSFTYGDKLAALAYTINAATCVVLNLSVKLTMRIIRRVQEQLDALEEST